MTPVLRAPAPRAQPAAGQPVIDRATPADLAFLAMDRGTVPEQFGVILLLDQAGEFDLARARQLIAGRIRAVPRLRQRLVRAPFGAGPPVWIDDAGFDIGRHVRAVACPAPGDERALLAAALPVFTTRLARAAPLWSAVFITGLAGGRVALAVVLHHVLADGVGGLAVLANLTDQGAAEAPVAFPRPAPGAGTLARDALRRRWHALRGAREGWRLLRTAMAAGGGVRPPRAQRCSLIQRTGPRRELAVIRTPLAPLRAAAHARGATTNDALLVAVAGALHRVLAASGERLGTVAVAVPVSGRADRAPALGNMVSPLLVRVPAAGDVGQRLRQVAAGVRAGKAGATGPAPIAVLGWLFRPLAALGGYHWYMNHQRRLHTLVTHVRGPAEQITFGGSAVSSAIPVSVGEGGNLTVCFGVFSYAGTVSITVVADPGHFRHLGALADALRAELGLITGRPAG